MPDGSRSARLDGGPQAPAKARGLVADWMGDDVAQRTVEDVKLLVSEVVTNAVRHPSAAGAISLTVTVRRGTVRVEVSDPGGDGFAKPKVSSPPPDALGGRGLLIVDRVASRWGVEAGTPTRVWFEVGS